MLAGEGVVSQMKQASNIILTSSTEPTSLHKDYIDDHTNAHISDLKEKIQGIASAMNTPIQKSKFAFTMH